MKRTHFLFYLIPLLSLLIFLCSAISCGDEESASGNGAGYTEDVGDTCIGLCDHDDWCTDVNLPNCVSFHCVGKSEDQMYCTQLCLAQEECPDGYACTINCTLDASGEPYCVKNDDYEYLENIGLCGPVL